MIDRHAYLIMAHNDFDLLTEILQDLDYDKNDIFLHVDLKAGDFPLEQMKSVIKKARFFPVPRMEVNWAGYSQIACEIHLLQQAVQQGKHLYYHLMTGATCPVRSQQDIHAFFRANAGDEFIGFVQEGDFLHRVRYYNLFNEIGKPHTKWDDRKIHIRDLFNAVQRKTGFIYGPAKGIEFQKGFAYWSLTQESVEYILSKKQEIYKVFRHSICGDEVFIHTLLYHSPYREKIHNLSDEYGSCLRYVKPAQSWKSDFGTTAANSSAPENGILKEDISEILSSGSLFALKFVGEKGLEAFRALKDTR